MQGLPRADQFCVDYLEDLASFSLNKSLRAEHSLRHSLSLVHLLCLANRPHAWLWARLPLLYRCHGRVLLTFSRRFAPFRLSTRSLISSHPRQSDQFFFTGIPRCL